MKYLTFILFVTLYCTSVIGLQPNGNNSRKAGEPRCFHFTWLGPFEEDKSTNCSSDKYKHTPCIEPFEISQTLPNVTEIWLRDDMDFTCPLQSGYSCIKYAYIFNQAILNISYFCGKMIEDTVSAVQTGCYSQQVGGHIIETCSCISSGFGIPCNSSSRNVYSLLGIIFFPLYIIINNIK